MDKIFGSILDQAAYETATADASLNARATMGIDEVF